MNRRGGPPSLLPTLTEVWTEPVPDRDKKLPGARPRHDAPPGAVGPPDGEPGEEQLVRAVLQDVQRHVDLMLEYRLRASLTPLLTQLADTLVRELRQELSETLHDVVKRSVNQELVRRRKR
ncbi:MAG: hypothetical protein RIQ60_112 [Pseudomonadota bacterium]|jgi:hypothetical protein